MGFSAILWTALAASFLRLVFTFVKEYADAKSGATRVTQSGIVVSRTPRGRLKMTAANEAELGAYVRKRREAEMRKTAGYATRAALEALKRPREVDRLELGEKLEVPAEQSW